MACLSLVRTEPADDGQSEADADVGQDDAQPDVVVQRVHEREHTRLLLLRLLDHDADAEVAGRRGTLIGRMEGRRADAEVHERLGEVDHALAIGRDRQRRHGYMSRLDNTVTAAQHQTN